MTMIHLKRKIPKVKKYTKEEVYKMIEKLRYEGDETEQVNAILKAVSDTLKHDAKKQNNTRNGFLFIYSECVSEWSYVKLRNLNQKQYFEEFRFRLKRYLWI